MDVSIAGLREYVKEFQGADYIQWRRRLDHALAFHNLLECTSRARPAPEPAACEATENGGTDNQRDENVAEWQNHDRRAIAVIEMCLSEPVMAALPSERKATSNLYLDALEERYVGNEDQDHQVAVPQAKEFADLKRGRDEEMRAFLGRVNKMRLDEYAATGFALTDEQVCEILLVTLPFEYFPLLDRLIMSSKSKEHMTKWEKTQESLVRLDGILSAYKQRREQWRANQSTLSPTAAAGGGLWRSKHETGNNNNSDNNNNNNNNNNNPAFSSLAQKRHTHEYLPHDVAPGSKEDYREWRCSFCGRPGHTASRCFFNPDGINYRGSSIYGEDGRQIRGRSPHPFHPLNPVWPRKAERTEVGDNPPSTRAASPTLSSYFSSA